MSYCHVTPLAQMCGPFGSLFDNKTESIFDLWANIYFLDTLVENNKYIFSFLVIG